MNSNDYGYGGQKRPLEDGGMHLLLLDLAIEYAHGARKIVGGVFVCGLFVCFPIAQHKNILFPL